MRRGLKQKTASNLPTHKGATDQVSEKVALVGQKAPRVSHGT